MRSSHFGSLVALAGCWFGLGLLAGCATQETSAVNQLSPSDYRFLYPRQYYDSADAWERRELDLQALREENKSQRK